MKLKRLKYTAFFLLTALPSMAQANETSSAGHPVVIVMLSIIGLLAAVIFLLGKVMIQGYEIHKKKTKANSKTITPLLIAGLVFFSQAAIGQDANPTPEAVSIPGNWVDGLSNSVFLLLASVIILEMIIIIYMTSVFRSFTVVKKQKPATVKRKKFSWLERLNNTKTVDETTESQYSLGHNYDGIEELDNPTPPWWQWGFVASAIFAVVYLWVYFVGKSAPNQIQEYELANAKAEEQIKAYMASSANNIDENTVKLLEDASDLNEGKKIFTANCAACHGADGGGIVGPNLTDNYWLHGGTVNHIFKTIKYGVPEKGMKSWKDDFTPKQIAMLASYIKSIKGTKPANPKEPQGELFEEE